MTGTTVIILASQHGMMSHSSASVSIKSIQLALDWRPGGPSRVRIPLRQQLIDGLGHKPSNSEFSTTTKFHKMTRAQVIHHV